MAADWLNPRVKGKEKPTDEKEELFVFGYACKLFRDDERALSIDKGSHLIPWMGDDKLLIDRYDGRGHLYDLKPYDSGHAQPCELTAEEEKLEELCNEERYLELHTDVAEKKLYEEEEWKRYYQSLSEGYGAVGFSYDYHSHQLNSEYYQADAEEEKPFEVPPELNLPDDITPPDTEKINAIIEKTAKFVVKQGAQMEILIKTKQANNSQFEFLHFENPLNLYYKHMVKMIKSGKYKPKEEAAEEEDPDNEDEDEGHGYLHPSLMVTRKASPAPEVPAYKPLEMPKISVHDTPYGQLIKTLAKKQQPDATEDVDQVSDYQDEIKPLKPPPLPPFYQDAGYSGNHHAHPPPPGIEPVTLPSRLQTEPPPPGTDVEGQMLPHRQTQLVMDDYQTQAQSRASPGPFDHIVPPPPDIQPVIDRMAMYVAKNGIEFEIVVKSKNDPRFQFLLPHHVHFPYYDFKKQIHMREAAKERGREMRDVEKPTAKLSFSIKPKAKEENKRKEKKKKKVFDNESSENDADSDKEKSSASGTSTPVGSDYTEEKIEKPQVPQEERDRKIAEDRLRDKLAHAAREKLAQTSREKQMQAERKRKAAMFINMLRSCNPGAAGDEEKLEEEFLNAKDSEKSTPVPTPGCSPYYGPLEKDKCEDVIAKKPKKSKHKDRSKRSRSRSPQRRRRRSRSPSPVRKLNRSHSPRRSRSPARRRSRSPARRRSRSPAHRGSGRDRHSSSKKSKKRRRSRTSSRSPKPKSNPEQPVSIDLTVDDSPEQPSVMNGDESSYSLSQYNLEQNQRMYDQREPSSDRLTPSLDADDSNSNASDSRSVSSYMRERVRAIIKASRKAIMEEEGSLFDDT